MFFLFFNRGFCEKVPCVFLADMKQWRASQNTVPVRKTTVSFTILIRLMFLGV